MRSGFGPISLDGPGQVRAAPLAIARFHPQDHAPLAAMKLIPVVVGIIPGEPTVKPAPKSRPQGPRRSHFFERLLRPFVGDRPRRLPVSYGQDAFEVRLEPIVPGHGVGACHAREVVRRLTQMVHQLQGLQPT